MKRILRWKFFEQKQRDQDKRNKIIFKKVLTTKKNSEMFFFKDLAWRTNSQEKTDHNKKKSNEFFFFSKKSKIFLVNFPKTKRQFLKRPKEKDWWKKIKKSNFEKNNKSEKHATHKATARRKEEKTRDLPQIKAGFQKNRHKVMKKLNISGNKNQMQRWRKVGKEIEKWGQGQKGEKKNEWNQKEKTQKRRWRKTDKETQDREEKRKRNMEIEK